MANEVLESKKIKCDMRAMQDEDFDWFLSHYHDLYNKYGKAFLAIKNKSVLGVYGAYAEAVKETALKETPGSFIVQECTDSPKGFTNYVASVGLTII